ncbi:MAG: protein kinase [Myxococcota bacterium]
MKPRQVVQRCPNCGAKYDVGIYVSGQKVRCRRCGIKFEVQRDDTPFIGVPGARAPRAEQPPPRPATKKPHRVAQNDLKEGTKLGGFEVRRVIGRGAMGTVYQGWQPSLDRSVAIKVMSSDLAHQDEFVKRFRREAAALAQLAHPHVVAIIDQGQVEKNYYLVMEFIDGPTLRNVLSRKQVRPKQAFALAIQVGHGMAYAHDRGVVHRDLKPENVLLADAGRDRVAKICDFGLADMLYSDRSFVNLTGSRISMGTVNYMAPEQRQDAGKVTQRADVYSFGVMVYEMLTGSLPLGRYAEPSVKNATLDKRLDPIIMRSLEVDARRRPPKVNELVEALERYAPS